MKKLMLSLVVISFLFSAIVTASEISSLIKDLGYKDTAKQASERLAEIGKPAIPALMKAIEDGSKYQKRYAVRAFRAMGQNAEDAIEFLSKLVDDKDKQTRKYLVETLANITNHNDKVIPILEYIRKNDRDKNIRKKAEDAILKVNTVGEYPLTIKQDQINPLPQSSIDAKSHFSTHKEPNLVLQIFCWAFCVILFLVIAYFLFSFLGFLALYLGPFLIIGFIVALFKTHDVLYLKWLIGTICVGVIYYVTIHRTWM